MMGSIRISDTIGLRIDAIGALPGMATVSMDGERGSERRH
jgi:hypothetical protein